MRCLKNQKAAAKKIYTLKIKNITHVFLFSFAIVYVKQPPPPTRSDIERVDIQRRTTINCNNKL